MENYKGGEYMWARGDEPGLVVDNDGDQWRIVGGSLEWHPGDKWSEWAVDDCKELAAEARAAIAALWPGAATFESEPTWVEWQRYKREQR